MNKIIKFIKKLLRIRIFIYYKDQDDFYNSQPQGSVLYDGQTVFDLIDTRNSDIPIFLNGVLQKHGCDYIIENGKLTWKNEDISLKTTDDFIIPDFIIPDFK